MESLLRVLHIDAGSGFYKMERYEVGAYFGPVDLGLHLARRFNSLNIGTGLLCGSIFPGSNRLVFTGNSPCWGSFYISSMGGAGLVFDNLGINMFSIRGMAPAPSVLYLNRVHGEEIEVEFIPVDADKMWRYGRGGVYAVMDTVMERFGDRYQEDPRILAVGPAARSTNFGAIASVPIKKGELSFVDTWAGRGGFGSKLFQQHGVLGIIYGGTYVDEDFRDRKVANQWFQNRYDKKMAIKDLDATMKYRLDPSLKTGGTFGVNYSKMGGRLLAFNYKSIYMTEDERLDLHQKFIVEHYLKQFNEEIIDAPKNVGMKNCGEPCVAVCKKMHGQYKKDYEPYQTMGPLCGIFDQRAAEKINHHADTLGFDAISIGGVLSWLMECLSEGILSSEELGVSQTPVMSPQGFSLLSDSMHNADIGIALMDGIIARRGVLDLLPGGPRKLARELARTKGRRILDRLVCSASARTGWMVPNQYWTPGVLSPMPIMGKYYMYYGDDFVPPRQLGRRNAERMKKEFILDNAGFCRFHRAWAEEMVPEIIETLWQQKEAFLTSTFRAASRINSRNASVYWEGERNEDFVHTGLKRMREVEGNNDPELLKWVDAFAKNKRETALEFWFEIQKGIHESLREF